MTIGLNFSLASTSPITLSFSWLDYSILNFHRHNQSFVTNQGMLLDFLFFNYYFFSSIDKQLIP